MSNNSQGNHPLINHLGGVLLVFVMTMKLFTGDGLLVWVGGSVVIWSFIWIVYQMGKGSK